LFATSNMWLLLSELTILFVSNLVHSFLLVVVLCFAMQFLPFQLVVDYLSIMPLYPVFGDISIWMTCFSLLPIWVVPSVSSLFFCHVWFYFVLIG
jgi:hypothetical protein